MTLASSCVMTRSMCLYTTLKQWLVRCVLGCVNTSTGSTRSTRSPPTERTKSKKSLGAKSVGTQKDMSARQGGWLLKTLKETGL
uniref:Putative secreted protein n=1 Tax=Ixodes ricinus TaxID=34613 RepID=A0A6B0U6Q8_IXORI